MMVFGKSLAEKLAFQNGHSQTVTAIRKLIFEKQIKTYWDTQEKLTQDWITVQEYRFNRGK